MSNTIAHMMPVHKPLFQCLALVISRSIRWNCHSSFVIRLPPCTSSILWFSSCVTGDSFFAPTGLLVREIHAFHMVLLADDTTDTVTVATISA